MRIRIGTFWETEFRRAKATGDGSPARAAGTTHHWARGFFFGPTPHLGITDFFFAAKGPERPGEGICSKIVRDCDCWGWGEAGSGGGATTKGERPIG